MSSQLRPSCSAVWALLAEVPEPAHGGVEHTAVPVLRKELEPEVSVDKGKGSGTTDFSHGQVSLTTYFISVLTPESCFLYKRIKSLPCAAQTKDVIRDTGDNGD